MNGLPINRVATEMLAGGFPSPANGTGPPDPWS